MWSKFFDGQGRKERAIIKIKEIVRKGGGDPMLKRGGTISQSKSGGMGALY